ncbi:MAG: TolC family protein, partial [Muribaculaceae bacterium]|nr:TolC family protein [Muribaculaceae bacterium]
PESYPDYLNDSLPQQWCYTPEHGAEASADDSEWWKTFNDATLDTLISMGMANNYDLSMALRRSQIARNAIGQARAAWMPSVGLSAGWTKSRESGMLTGVHGPASGMSYFSAGLNASWEIDLFGKIASGVKAKKAGYMASKAEYAGTMVSVCAQIAATYVEVRMYQELLEIARIHTENQMKIVNIAKARFETTLASKLDVAQALETYYSTTASIPMLENSVHTSLNALAVLTGENKDRIARLMSTPAKMPDPFQIINAGVPMDLLRRRPDIAQAEMELAGYAAEMGIAKKDFLPTLRLDGTIGTSAHNAGDLFSHDSFTYSIAPTLSWTIFDGLSRKYALASARETFRTGIDNYNLTVITAVEEADNAMSTYIHSLKHIDTINQVIEQNEEALRLAVERYKTSLSPMSDVVTAQLNSLAAESDLVSARGSALSALISLYEALGGGFNASSL